MIHQSYFFPHIRLIVHKWVTMTCQFFCLHNRRHCILFWPHFTPKWLACCSLVVAYTWFWTDFQLKMVVAYDILFFNAQGCQSHTSQNLKLHTLSKLHCIHKLHLYPTYPSPDILLDWHTKTQLKCFPWCGLFEVWSDPTSILPKHKKGFIVFGLNR